MRIDKFLSNLNYGSRTDIKKFVKQKMVRINDNLVKNASETFDELVDEIYFDDELVFYKKDIIVALNKPTNYICSNVDELYPSILNLLPTELVRLDLSICGRLDVDTQGLVILTNSGDYVHKIISPNKDVYKRYLVHTLKSIKNISKFENGLTILDGRGKEYLTNKATLELMDETKCIVSIKEGKFHQVKRMFEAIDNEVVFLKRLSVGKYELPNDLELGEYQLINIEDIL